MSCLGNFLENIYILWGRRWEGGTRERRYMHTYLPLIHVEVRQKARQYWNAIIFQLKIDKIKLIN